MAIGPLIRDLRLARGWSQDDLASALNLELPDATMTRSEISRYESEKRLPTAPHLIEALSRVLDIPSEVIKAETRVSRVERRTFVSLAALSVVHGQVAKEIYSSIAGRDSGPLATVQTTHGTDLVIASMIKSPAVQKLTVWMSDGSESVLRVNAAGILAKLPNQSAGALVSKILTHDAEVRRLYATAVISRVCAVEWSQAARFALDPSQFPDPVWAARKFAIEAFNPRDSGARWCSAAILRELTPMLGGRL